MFGLLHSFLLFRHLCYVLFIQQITSISSLLILQMPHSGQRKYTGGNGGKLSKFGKYIVDAPGPGP